MKARNLFLVEDNPNDEMLLTRSFRKVMPDLSIEVFRDGRSCIDRISACLAGETGDPPRPSLILLDLKLPKLDGFGVLRHIREKLEIRALPIVILSSSDETLDVVRSYELGANGYLRKPDSLEEFAKLVETVGNFWLQANRLPPPNPTLPHSSTSNTDSVDEDRETA